MGDPLARWSSCAVTKVALERPWGPGKTYIAPRCPGMLEVPIPRDPCGFSVRLSSAQFNSSELSVKEFGSYTGRGTKRPSFKSLCLCLFFFFFLRPHLWQMEVLWPGTELTYTSSCGNTRSFNPVHWAGDRSHGSEVP